MVKLFFEFFVNGPKRISATLFNAISDVNKRYAKPQIKMSKSVKFSLLCLRFYLIFLILLLVYKFITILMHK